jgi:hypothetical protein
MFLGSTFIGMPGMAGSEVQKATMNTMLQTNQKGLDGQEIKSGIFDRQQLN